MLEKKTYAFFRFLAETIIKLRNFRNKEFTANNELSGRSMRTQTQPLDARQSLNYRKYPKLRKAYEGYARLSMKMVKISHQW